MFKKHSVILKVVKDPHPREQEQTPEQTAEAIIKMVKKEMAPAIATIAALYLGKVVVDTVSEISVEKAKAKRR